MKKVRLCFLLLVTVTTFFREPAFAIEGIGALGDRIAEQGVVSISGYTSPWAEVIVVNEKNEDQVVAVGEVESDGEFEFSFKYEGVVSDLAIFAKDSLGISSRVRLKSLSERLLLPPTIVEDFKGEAKDLAVKGLTYPGSEVRVRIKEEKGEAREVVTQASGIGEWTLFESNMRPGKYEASGVSSAASLISEASQTLLFEIDVVSSLPGGGIINQLTNLLKGFGGWLLLLWMLYLLRLSWRWLLEIALGTMIFLFWGRGEKEKWGVVYNSMTKEPVKGVLVKLYKEGKLMEMTVSNQKGEFYFNHVEGEVRLKLWKLGYNFFSKKVVGKGKDGEYKNLYYGEVFKVQGSMTPVSVAGDEIEPLGGVGKLIKGLTVAMGSGLGVYGVINGGSVVFMGMLLLSLIATLSWVFDIVFGGYGVVVNSQGMRLRGVEVRLLSKVGHEVLMRRVSSEAGKYRFYVEKGEYLIVVEGEDEGVEATAVSEGWLGVRLIVKK